MIGTAIFSTPSAIAESVGSAGAALALWVAGLILAYCGLFIWIELGSLMPRSGGEKVYLEAAYPKPRMLVTTVFAVHVIFLGFTGKFRTATGNWMMRLTDKQVLAALWWPRMFSLL